MFSKLGKKPIKYPSESRWTVLQEQYEGHPMFARRNDSARVLLKSSVYTHRVGIAIPLLNPNGVGLPSQEETEILIQIEDELCEKLQKDQIAIQVLAITTNGMREFVFYTRNPEITNISLVALKEKFLPREIQSYTEEDKTWTLYKQFA